MSEPSTPDDQPASAVPEPEPAPEPSPPAAPASAGWRSWAVAGVAAGLVVVAGIVLTRDRGDDSAPVQASAQTPAGGEEGPGGFAFAPRGAQGKITKLDGDTITLSATGRDGTTSTVTVEVGSGTKVTDVVDGTTADVAVGDHVLVRGEVVDGTVTAESLTDQGDEELARGGASRRAGGGGGAFTPPEGAAPPDGMTPPDAMTPPGGGSRPAFGGITFGTVTKVDGDEVTVSTVDDQTVVVTVTGDTDVKVTKDISVDDLKVGDEVRAEGERDGDTVTADAIRRGGDALFAGGAGPGGGFRQQVDGSASGTASATASAS